MPDYKNFTLLVFMIVKCFKTCILVYRPTCVLEDYFIFSSQNIVKTQNPCYSFGIKHSPYLTGLVVDIPNIECALKD